MQSLILMPKRLKLDQNIADRLAVCRGAAPQSWELIPVVNLNNLIIALDEGREPANMDQAKATTEILLGSYPRHAVEAPKIYTRAIVSVLITYPAQIGSKAVDNLTLSSKWMPTRAEVNDHCKVLMDDLKAAKTIATAMLKEHERRETEQRETAERAKSRQEFRDKHGEKSPMDVLKAEGISIGGNSKRNEK